MSKPEQPRNGSMQYWPRKRAKREFARIGSWKSRSGQAKMLAFAGYKVGMTHIIYTDNGKNSMTKGQEVSCPVTVIECPPIKVAGIRFYKHGEYGPTPSCDILSSQLDKNLKRRISIPKNIKHKIEDITGFDDLRIIAYTQPSATGIGKKRPEIFEIGLSGKKGEKFELAKQLLTKTINVNDVFAPGETVDAHAITKGKGVAGPVKRFGVAIRQHKSEKTKRGPGSLGPWCGQRHIMYRVAHAGKMGYHQRTDYSKWIMCLSNEPDKVNPKGGFVRYGEVRNSYLLVKGSIPGPAKRLILFTPAMRPNKMPVDAPEIAYISTESKQG